MNPPENVKFIPVILADGLELGVHPETIRLFNLRPGQKIDLETFKKIIRANQNVDKSATAGFHAPAH
jgi:hypothetical protein